MIAMGELFMRWDTLLPIVINLKTVDARCTTSIFEGTTFDGHNLFTKKYCIYFKRIVRL